MRSSFTHLGRRIAILGRRASRSEDRGERGATPHEPARVWQRKRAEVKQCSRPWTPKPADQYGYSRHEAREKKDVLLLPCSELADHTDAPNEIAETVLAHAVGGKVERAYRRTDNLELRRDLKQQWAEFCTGGSRTKTPNVD